LLKQFRLPLLNGVLLVLLTGYLGAASAAGFSITDTEGKRHQLSDYRGKWVLVNFWATWCPPCVEEIPEFSALYQERSDGDLMVLGVALEFADAQAVIDFAASHSMSYPLVLGNERIVAQFGGVKVLPSSYLYDQKGKLVLRRVGALSREEIEVIIGKRPKEASPKAVLR
jgi:thiol-disulfide isomerase/thioredoxin